MATLIPCVSCKRRLRVPDDRIGKRVKCPACGTVFVAELQPPEVAELDDDFPTDQPSTREQDYESYHREDAQPDEAGPRRRRPRSTSTLPASVQGPAVALIVVGVLGLLLALGAIAFQAFTPAGLAPPPVAPPPEQKNEQAFKFGVFIGFYGVMVLPLVWGVVVTLGGIQMYRRQGKILPYAGSIFALLPCSPCCLLGLPSGIWALIALNRS